MGISQQSANCRERHWPRLSCPACGWTSLDDWIFLDDKYQPVDLQTKIEFLYDNGAEPADIGKVTLFWLKRRNTHKDE